MTKKEIYEEIIGRAIKIRENAYAPYSKYKVGASLLVSSGKIYDGVNVENAAYPSVICAERAAVCNAVSEGEREFEAIVIATENGGTPCGGCRQVLSEFGGDTEVLIVDLSGKILIRTNVKDLLPGAFGPENLPLKL